MNEVDKEFRKLCSYKDFFDSCLYRSTQMKKENDADGCIHELISDTCNDALNTITFSLKKIEDTYGVDAAKMVTDQYVNNVAPIEIAKKKKISEIWVRKQISQWLKVLREG